MLFCGKNNTDKTKRNEALLMKKKIKKYPSIYLALAVCIVAVGIGSAIGFANRPKPESETDNSDFNRVTVQWNIETTVAPLTEEANIGISGVADERAIPQTTTENNKPFSGNFALPMGTDIIKDFSNGEMVHSETMGDWRVHNGVDFGGSAGNEVLAVSSGKVTKVYDDSFWGTVAEIDHGNGMTVRYCGLKNGSCLPEGTKVEKYDKIGSLGHIPVEVSDADHLHLEVLIDGEYVDPLKALNKVSAEE